MSTIDNNRKLAVILLVIALMIVGLTSISRAAGVVQVDNSGPCVTGTGNPPYTTIYCKIQDAITDAAAGDVITVANGTYPEILNITKGLALVGASEAGVVIDATSATGYHFTVKASNVTLQNFTLKGKNTSPASYGIKVEGVDTLTRHTNFSISDVTVEDTYRTGLDINGLEGVSVNDVTVTGVPWGNGVSLTDVDDAVLDDITTSGNYWGGVGVYTYGRYYPLGSDNVTVTDLTAAEPNPFYVEIGNYNVPGSPAPVTNLSAPQFFYTVVNEPEKLQHTFYQETEPLAVAFALGFTTPFNSYVNRLADGNFIVSNDGVKYMGIQTAIDEATSGATIEVRDGAYVEVLTVNAKDLTIVGDSTSAIVRSPASVPICFSTSYDYRPIVCIKGGSNVTLDTLTIDGDGQGNANNRFVGVGINNSSATVQDSVITGVRDTPFSGSQHGVAVYSWNENTVSQTVNVWNNDIIDFQKNAMALNADSDTPMVVSVEDNVVTGAGATPVTAQNGIQTLGDLITGNVENNVLTGIGYSGTYWVATTLLNYYGAVDYIGNDITAAQVGLYNIDGSGDIDGNRFGIDDIGDYSYGIIATDPPQAVPSPFGDGDAVGEGGVRGSYAPEATLTVNITDNLVVFTGVDNTATYGIEADSGYGVDDLAVTATGNVVNGFDVGIGWYECTSSCSTGVFTSIFAQNNCIEDNNTGMESNVSVLTVNAESNWWGDASGPYNNPGNLAGLGDPVVGDIDFDPWSSTCSAGDLWRNATADTIHIGLQAALDAASSGDVIEPYGAGPHAGGATANTPNVTISLNGGTGGPGSPFLTVAAANITVLGPGTLDGMGSSDPAIRVNAGGNNFILKDVEVTDWANGVQVAAPVVSFKMVDNYVHGNSNAGLRIDSGATLSGVITIEGNLFKANTAYGVENLNGVSLDAEYNSWGCFAGPGGACNVASANVDYDPWTFSEMFLDMDPPGELGLVSVLEGESFYVDMKVDAKNLTALSFDFTYDSTMLTLNGPPTFTAPWAGACAPVGSPPVGQAYYQCNIFFPAPGYTAMSSIVATFNFTAEDNGGLTGAGPWSTYFDLDEDTTTSASIGGVKVFVNNAGYGAVETRSLIDDSNDGQVDIGPTANYTGFIDLQGRSNDTGGVLNVYDTSVIGSAVLQATGTSVSSGSYTTSGLLMPTGLTFWLYADAPLYLPTTATGSVLYAHSAVLTTRPLTPLNLLLLKGGDATDNNMINILDATCIGTDFGMFVSTCGTGSSDVNGDGIINVLDLSLMGGNWMGTFSSWTPQ